MRVMGLLTVATLLAGCVTVPRVAVEDPAAARRADELLAGELTAEFAVEVALARSPRLRAVYEDLNLAQADVVQAGLPRNPSVGLSLSLPIEAGGVGAGLSIAQSVVDLLQLPLRKRLAGAALEAAKLRVTGEILDLVAETRAAFFELQAASQLREMRESVRDALEGAYELAKERHAAGNLNDYGLALERTQFEESKLALAAAEAEVEVARTHLDSLMGTSGRATEWRFAPRLPSLPGAELDLERLESRAVERSLELAVLRQDLVVAGGSLGLARTFAFLPGMTLGAGAERETDGVWKAGPSLELPIPLFDQGQARIASAEALARRLHELEAQVGLDVRASVRAARARLLGARQRVGYLHAVVLPLRGRVVAEAQLQFNAMQIGALSLISARQEEIEAGARFVAELRGYWLARTEVEKLANGRLGRGAPESRVRAESASRPQGRGEGHE